MKKTLILCLLASIASCTTLKKCERKFAKTITDTVTIKKQIVVTIPKDSSVLRIITDTTTLIREVRQGRATVRIVREPTYTTVYASCDSARIVKEATLRMPKNTIQIGVNKNWKYAFFVALGLLLLLITALWLNRIFTFKIERK